jgi:hypothetical protein
MVRVSYKNKIRRILARVLLVIYSIILLVMYTHVHYSNDVGKCVSESSCVNRLYHSEYFSSHKAINHECFICKLLNLPYLFPKIINFIIFITVIGFVSNKNDQRGSIYCNVIKSSRGPPLRYFKHSL